MAAHAMPPLLLRNAPISGTHSASCAHLLPCLGSLSHLLLYQAKATSVCWGMIGEPEGDGEDLGLGVGVLLDLESACRQYGGVGAARVKQSATRNVAEDRGQRA